MPKLTNLDVDLLRAFVTIADLGSFTRAADRLYRTQSTISLQIKKLEEQLGKPLLERNARRVRLTAEGEHMLPYCRQILRLNDELVSQLREPELAGLVRIGTPEDFATTRLPGVLARFAKAYPRVALEVTCDLTLNLMDKFEAGEFDLVLVKREPLGPALGAKVWREPLVWASAPAMVFDPAQPLPLIVSPQPCVYRKRAMSALDRTGRSWRVAYTSPSLAGTQAAVHAGLGVTILPKEMVPPGLQVLGENEGMPDLEDTEIALCRRPGPPSRPVDRLAEHIIRALETRDDPIGVPA
jgi:DNA-binding transcriptional LysR family regulator